MDAGGPLRLGDRLVFSGAISAAARDAALEGARLSGARFGQTLAAQGHLSGDAMAGVLAQELGLPHADLTAAPPDPALLSADEISLYVALGVLPWRRQGGHLVLAIADPDPAGMAEAARRFGACTFATASRSDIHAAILARFGETVQSRAVWALADATPQFSADRVATPAQLVALYIAACAALAAAAAAPAAFFAAFAGTLSALFFGSLSFKAWLVWRGGRRLPDDAPPLPDAALPVYTVLAPLYREDRAVPGLVAALRALDYPAAKLDIKLIVEADDAATVAAAEAHGACGPFEVVRVPPGNPRTKPKACNYALALARGALCVIYDAEDRPEPDQLRQAAARFAASTPEVACLQARLTAYNARENWITRMFTLDYALWFDYFLPGLERMGAPIPLGGTSNHFRTDVLRRAGAWDPHNVAEDADLGVRLRRLGYRVGTLASTTFEEAVPTLGGWTKQRTRWIKGYMQTWLVHMRTPFGLFARTGPAGFAAFQLFVGGTVLTGLLNPVLWALFVWWLAAGGDPAMALPEPVAALAMVSLAAGNGLFIYLAMIGPLRRRWYGLSLYGLTAFAYWALVSVAAWRALFQLIFAPFYWEKTTHGLTRATAAAREAA